MSLLNSLATDHFPTLSTAERDRRWALLRDFLTTHGLDALVVFGWGRHTYDQYLTGEQQGSVVVLTHTGEPVSIAGDVPLEHYDEAGTRYPRWVNDIRIGDPADRLPEILAEHSLTAGTLGIVGLTSRSVDEWDGVIPYTTWQAVASKLPKATFVDVGDAFETLVMVKSPEELTMVRKAAEIGELACAAFADAVRPGVLESAAPAAALHAIVANGGWTAEPWILERAGSSRFAWGRPEWMSMGGAPHTLRRGDSIAAEIFSFYGGFESQQQMDVCLGEPDRLLRELEEVCLESYRAGIDALRPGIRFAELCEIMHEPLHRSRTWNTGPLVQTISPVIYNGATRVNPQVDPALAHLPSLPVGVGLDGDFTVTEGVVFAFEPNALRDGKRVCIGGTVIMGPDGPEELNTLPNRLIVVEA
ncbi:M24 family metallopeptidase [Streptomyces sp. NPDC046821]|uniref:M24 family metallopeptidase n=1 Tax=Streptomyces sp. NPDC046821 TaxID=3154702 RepID=UPI0033C5E6B3